MNWTGIAALIISFCLLAEGAPSWKDKGDKGNGNGNGRGRGRGQWKGTPVEGPAEIVDAIGEGRGRAPPKGAPPGQKKKAERSFIVNPGPAMEFNPLEHQEGDDIMPPSGKEKRGIFYQWGNKWPNGVIPYEIDEAAYATLSNGQQLIDVIHAAMDDYHNFTCIKFVKRTTESTYLWFSPAGSACWSYIGMRSGRQQLSIGSSCGQKGVAIHEMLHALGFHHEQNRPDRDDYVKVLEANVSPALLHNFNKLTAVSSDTMGFGYDYLSVMHYGLSFFSINGQPTLELTPGNEEWKMWVGRQTGFSNIDLNELNKKYGCPNPMIYPDLCIDFYESWCTTYVVPDPEGKCDTSVRINGVPSSKWQACPKTCGKCHWKETTPTATTTTTTQKPTTTTSQEPTITSPATADQLCIQVFATLDPMMTGTEDTADSRTYCQDEPDIDFTTIAYGRVSPGNCNYHIIGFYEEANYQGFPREFANGDVIMLIALGMPQVKSIKIQCMD